MKNRRVKRRGIPLSNERYLTTCKSGFHGKRCLDRVESKPNLDQLVKLLTFSFNYHITISETNYHLFGKIIEGAAFNQLS